MSRVYYPIELKDKEPLNTIIELQWLRDGSLESTLKNKQMAEDRIGMILRSFQQHSGSTDIHIAGIEISKRDELGVYLKTELV